MKIKMLLSALAAVCCLCVIGASYPQLHKSAELKVAIYDNGVENKIFGLSYIYDALKNAKGVKAELIDNLASDTLKKYDVVVISTVTKLSKKDQNDTDRGIKGTDWIKTLTNYVDCGGGLVIGHNAIGLRGIFVTYKLFPMIGTTCSRNLDANYFVKDASHPVMNGIPSKFNHQYDHMEIISGKNGQVLAVDKFDKGVVIAGDVSRGRVVQIGFPMGVYWKGKTGELTATDKQLLLNAVNWAGAKPKYDVPLKDTESGLLAETMKVKLDEEKAQLAKFANLPMPKFDEAVIWAPGQWLESGATITSREQVAKIIDNCKKMGFNKIVINMKHGKFYYPTNLKSLEKKEKFYYAECVFEEAAKRGMKISMVYSPFFNSLDDGTMFPLGVDKAEYVKLQQGKMKPEEIGKDSPWVKKNCPDYQPVRQRAIDVVVELINKYHPEEIYLDFIRYKDGYDTSCFCDYSLKRKAEFAEKHPEISKDKLDAEFSKASLLDFINDLKAVALKHDPKIKFACYTISAPECKAPAWVNQYPVDWHAKYVSRHTYGPESSLDDTSALTNSYSKWINSGSHGSQFSPIIATYDTKSADRILAELKIVSDGLNKNHAKVKRFEFFDYGLLLKSPKKNLEINEDMASGISQALGGDIRKSY